MGQHPRQQYLQQLQTSINYQFKNLQLLDQALTHRSHSARNNERLEFIGDGILDYVVAKMLFDAFPKLTEGRLSQLRAQLVKEATLAEIARELKIGPALNLGIGELKSGGADRTSILADALEALFAAVSLDGDFMAAEAVIQRLFNYKVAQINDHTVAKDAKTSLQEYLQAKRWQLPKYRIDNQYGEGNQAVFEISCDLGELGYITYAKGNNRRVAEQECAKQALTWLETKFGKMK